MLQLKMSRGRIAFASVNLMRRLWVPNYQKPSWTCNMLQHNTQTPIRQLTERASISYPRLSKVVLTNDKILEIEQILMHKFKDRAILAQALTHRSVLNHNIEDIAYYESLTNEKILVPCNNERLELLGDKVFGMAAIHVLYEDESVESEGKITQLSQSLVSRKCADLYCRYVSIKHVFPENQFQT